MISLLASHLFGVLLTLPTFLAQTDTDVTEAPQNSLAGAVGGGIGLIVGLFVVVCLWKIFSKAGQPGWAAIIPIYNYYIWCKIVGRPGWWVLLLFLCFPIFYIILTIDLAKAFGKGVGFAIGMILLPIIFFPILAFGDAQYIGAPAAGA